MAHFAVFSSQFYRQLVPLGTADRFHHNPRSNCIPRLHQCWSFQICFRLAKNHDRRYASTLARSTFFSKDSSLLNYIDSVLISTF